MAKAVAIGALRHEIELIDITGTPDGSGGWLRSGNIEAVVDGAVNPASWSQQEKHGGRLEQRISHVISIRWDPDLARTYGPEARARFVDDAGRVRELSVKTVVDPDERGRWLELGCIEGGPL